MSKLWGGRFEKHTEKYAESFHSSIAFDSRLYKQDVLGSIAHAHMLGAVGVISPAEAQTIAGGLQAILADIENGLVSFDTQDEDIHMNIERLLIERIGDIGKKLHTGRSRNDQVALDIRMYMKEGIISVQYEIKRLLTALLDIAANHTDTIMPAYTHLQKAQPTTLAHYMMAYFEMFRRDHLRFSDCLSRTDSMPLGSGALCATTYPLDRDMVAKELGFSAITNNSMDAVSDRDFLIEFCSCAAICMMHLSRFCEELILWSTNEFKMVTMDDAYATGSSIMPQKKNPDMAELIRGKTGRVYGSLTTLLTVMKGLPLAYNKDMQEDKEAVFNAFDTLYSCLKVFTGMIQTVHFNKEQMLTSAGLGFTNATDAADYLVKKGLPFRSAHEVVGRLVLYCEQHRQAIDALPLDILKTMSPLFEDDVYAAVSLNACVSGRKVYGGPAKESMLAHMEKAKAFLAGI
jgi:argininosuccinate lyase